MNDSKSISITVSRLTRYFETGKGKLKNPSSERTGRIVANDNLSFEVKRGEIFGLLGPNGAGKTTLINQLLGLIKPNAGQIWIEGIDVVKNPDHIKKWLGFLPQTGLPMRNIEVEKALLFTGCLRGQSLFDAKQQTAQLMGTLGIEQNSKQYVSTLSGGVLRLVNFAMALMGRPQILVLDEPTNELDPHNRKLIWDVIERLNSTQGITCVLVTHNVAEAERVVQRVAVMREGRFVALGTPGEIKQKANTRVRLELYLKEGRTLNLQDFNDLGDIENPKDGLYRMYLAPQFVSRATDLVVNRIGLDQLDDFRLAPPSLEDVYLSLDLGKTTIA